MSEEQLARAIEIQKQRVQDGDSLPLGMMLLEMEPIDRATLGAELEKQTLERVRLYGTETRID